MTREDRANGGDFDIAAVGAMFADVARCRMILALSDGSELPATRLAAEADVTAATASSHLKKLTDAGLVTVERQGRNRNYKLAGPEVGELIEALEHVAPFVAARSLRQSSRARRRREARTCYDHFAGHLGVALLDGLLERGFLIPVEPAEPGRAQRPRYRVSDAGAAELTGLGLEVRPGLLIEGHRDSTELRPHLAGRHARALANRMLDMGWVEKAGQRTVRVTDLGVKELRARFGLSLGA
jgi:DNA-binding transcriptional ArsR family regulator